MFELAERAKELPVEVEGGAVTLYMEPLSDEEYYQLTETADIEGEGESVRVVFLASRLPGAFERHFRRAEGAGVEGEPFDPSDAEHLKRIPQRWKGAAMTRLIRYAMGMDAEMGNDSKPRDGSSPAAETHSED